MNALVSRFKQTTVLRHSALQSSDTCGNFLRTSLAQVVLVDRCETVHAEELARLLHIAGFPVGLFTLKGGYKYLSAPGSSDNVGEDVGRNAITETCSVHCFEGFQTAYGIARAFDKHAGLLSLAQMLRVHMEGSRAQPCVIVMDGLDQLDTPEPGQLNNSCCSRADLVAAVRRLLGFAMCEECWHLSSQNDPKAGEAMLLLTCREQSLLPPWVLLPRESSDLVADVANTLPFQRHATRSSHRQAHVIQVDTLVELPATATGATSATPENGLASSPSLLGADFPSTPWDGFHGYSALKDSLMAGVIRPFMAASAWNTKQYRDTAAQLSNAVGTSGRNIAGMLDSATFELAESLHQMDARPPAGLLLVGPPGTGKTTAARCIARAAGAFCLHVSCARLLSRYVGDSEAGLRRVFAAARAMQPCVLILDGVDAVATARHGLVSGITSDHGSGQAATSSLASLSASPAPASVLERLLATLLAEMDGLGQRSSSLTGRQKGNQALVLVVGTCTVSLGDSLQLDTALLRPGRFEVVLDIQRPDPRDRRAILASHSAIQIVDGGQQSSMGIPGQYVPLCVLPETLDLVATGPTGDGSWSATNLCNLVTEAACVAAARIAQSSKRRRPYVEFEDFMEAAASMQPSISVLHVSAR